jgi:glyoxylase-like metal-dependent hydrolase (beta-lactamase superfamily II)
LVDGASIVIAGGQLEVLHTPGHSPGHICLVSPRQGIIFTGDHILSETTPNIGIFPTALGGRPDRNPLADYIASLERVLPFGDLLALPGHERRVSVAERAADILDHHEEQLANASALVAAGHTTVREIAERMPWSFAWGEYGIIDRHLALAEVYAHLVVLQQRGEIELVATDPLRWRQARPLDTVG